MWDATATKNGICIRDWKINTIPDVELDAAFGRANNKLQDLIGLDDPNFLRLGWIAYGESRNMLAYGTKRPVFNYGGDGTMVWTEGEVQEINKGVDWTIPSIEELEQLGFGYYVPGCYEDYLHQVRLFWETCVENRLGIYFAF